MKNFIITPDQLRAESASAYNSAIWNQKIDSYLKYENCTFYVNRKEDSAFDYDRYFVSYTLPEGLNLIQDFGYHSSLSSAGFTSVSITQMTEAGQTMKDVLDIIATDEAKAKMILDEMAMSNIVDIVSIQMKDANGNKLCYSNSNAARQAMIQSSKYGVIFSKNQF